MQQRLVIASHIGYLAGTPAHVLVRAESGTKLAAARLTWAANSADLGTPSSTPLAITRTLTPVDGWTIGNLARIDLPNTLKPGWCQVSVEFDDATTAATQPFRIDDSHTLGAVLSDVLYYFKAVRSSGEIDRKDAHALRWDDPTGLEVDGSGGWLDASGDTSKYLSHLTYTSMMTPQQIPLCVWAMLAARDVLQASGNETISYLDDRLRDEALFGADFLTRFRAPEGYFYVGLYDGLTKQMADRQISGFLPGYSRVDRYQAAYSHGGGLAIAALARASTADDHGAFDSATYLRAAQEGFGHLEAHNLDYRWDHTESIIDDYCALLAASELIIASRRASPNPTQDAADYSEAASRRARQLIARYQPGDAGKPGYLVGDSAGRPYFHAVESGLPVIALLRFSESIGDALPDLAGQAQMTALQIMRDWVRRTDGVANPSGYPRALVQPTGEPPREQFFYPHANETGYWWQGENANISSIAAAALATARLPQCDVALAARLRQLAGDALTWITGCNPFDVCMIHGRGHGNVEYQEIWPSVPGGISNGVTSGWDDERDIAFMPIPPVDIDEAWRWGEQWIPHAGWFLLAGAATIASVGKPGDSE